MKLRQVQIGIIILCDFTLKFLTFFFCGWGSQVLHYIIVYCKFLPNWSTLYLQNDKVELLKPGSLQHLGENMFPFLIDAASSTDFPGEKIMNSDHNSTEDTAIYFDILVLIE